MPIDQFLQKLRTTPESVEFDEVIGLINAHYHYTPARFTNGPAGDQVINEAGTNEGSCRIFAFAQLQGLSEAETLACFGRFYRDDVLKHPDATNHANIRTFMRHGWSGIRFDREALIPN